MHRILVHVACVCLVVQGAHADWPGFRGNPQLTGVARSPLADAPELLWAFETGESIESTPAVVGNRVYVGTIDSLLHAVDLRTGKALWAYRASDAIKSSPLVSGGVVYFGDESGRAHAVDAESGQARWTFQTEGAVISSAVRMGNRILFGSYDNSLYCLNARDGSQAWKLETEGYVHATPSALGDSAVAVSGCDALLRLVDVESGQEIRQIEVGAYVGASMAVVDQMGFVGTFGNRVLSVDLAAGKIVWEYENPDRQFPYYASPAVTGRGPDDTLVIGGRDRLVHALKASDGSLLWTHAAGSRVDASPVIVRNGTGESRAVVATLNGRIEILDLTSGASVWHFETGSGFTGSPAVSQGRLIIGSDDGILYCFGSK